MSEFLELGAKIVGLCAASYAVASAPLRAVEYPLSARASGVRPGFIRFAARHLAAAVLNALVTPVVCYLLSALIFRAGGFTQPQQFAQSFWYTATLWVAGLWMPVQSTYYVNGRLFSGADMAVRPQWLIYFWGINSCVAATLMWLPLWLGCVAL
ncbi:MAG: hypothetical protein IT462_13290 [Planctomycetes bacterium]|nr:hypothetical protein [Planctomycetota bacterium]